MDYKAKAQGLLRHYDQALVTIDGALGGAS